MFTQFRVRYPQGCLISELLTIKHGKYVVRVMVQVEGVTQATGLAAAETIELAEDQARIRALAVLGVQPTIANEVSFSETALHSAEAQARIHSPELQEVGARSTAVAPRFVPSGGIDTSSVLGEVPGPHSAPISIPQPTFSSEQLRQADQIPIVSENFGINKNAAGLFSRDPKHPNISSSDAVPMSWEANSIPFGDNFSLSEPEAVEQSDASEVETSPAITSKPVLSDLSSRTNLQGTQGIPESQINLPVASASKFSFGQAQINTEKIAPTSDSFDMSDIIARTDVEMKRLGWSTKQGRDHLVQTYGKRGRAQLTDGELLDFMHYLEAQPSPED